MNQIDKDKPDSPEKSPDKLYKVKPELQRRNSTEVEAGPTLDTKATNFQRAMTMSAKFTQILRDKFKSHNALHVGEKLLLFSNFISNNSYITTQISQ